MVEHLGAFIAISCLLIVVPGPDMAFVTRNAVLGGRGSGIATGVGAVVGLLLWTIAASLGLAALLRASEPAFLALKIVGGAYLVYLGTRTLVTAFWELRRRSVTESVHESSRLRPRIALRQGLLSNLGNRRSPSSSRPSCRGSCLQTARRSRRFSCSVWCSAS
jgi:threonine/homoserine/homoserine lactone efflux protein